MSINASGQRVSLSDLISLCSKPNWEEVNHSLMSKGWEYYDSEKGDETQYNTIVWSFNKERFSDKAQGWFYLYTYEGFPNKIVYQTFDSESYGVIQKSISTLGFKLISSGIEDGEVTSNYANQNYTLEVSIEKRETTTGYSFMLIRKASKYDPDNGKKTDYYRNGVIQAIYTLKDGKVEGAATLFHENGNKSMEGVFKGGKGNGKFKEYNDAGHLILEYTKVDDKANGVLKKYVDGKLSEEITYLNDSITGKYVDYNYDSDGILYLKIIGNFKNGDKDGLWKTILIEEGEEETIEYQNYKDDLKHGEVKEYIGSDTLEIAHYENGVLNGAYTRQIKVKGYSSDSGKEVGWWNTDCEGIYKDGLKNGKWTLFTFGIKSEEGNYINDKKEGKWTSYNFIGKVGEVNSISNYENNYLNGITERYYFYDSYIDSTDSEKLMKFLSVPVYELITFEDDLKTGRYILKDSAGLLIREGSYLDDEKTGEWVEAFLVKNDDESSYQLFQKGSYANDNREGEWIEYLKEGEIIRTYNYKDGLRNGESLEFNSGVKSSLRIFKDDQLSELTEFDSLGLKPLRKYEIYGQNPDSHICNFTIFYDSIYVSQEYWVKNDNGEVEDELYDFSFFLKTMDESNIELAYKNGKHTINKSNGQPLIIGNYKGGQKSDLWTYYYYDQGLKVTMQFPDPESRVPGSVIGPEKYYNLNDIPFSGEFVLYDNDDGTKEVRSIRKGLRHGITIYTSIQTGQILKKEKYSKGVLK